MAIQSTAQTEEFDREAGLKRLREKIARAIEQADRGESVDGEAFMTEFLAEMGLEMPPVKVAGARTARAPRRNSRESA